jgi:Protein  of unknown function (DUF3018)
MSKVTAARKSVQRYRDRMRRSGLRLVQLWIPDTRARGFAAECRRQSLAAAANKRSESDLLRWIEAARDDEGWTA